METDGTETVGDKSLEELSERFYKHFDKKGSLMEMGLPESVKPITDGNTGAVTKECTKTINDTYRWWCMLL
jgi:hypothetical protein